MIRNALRFTLAAALGMLSIHASIITSVPTGAVTTTFQGSPPGVNSHVNCFTGPTTGVDAGFGINASSDACYNNSGGFEFGYPGDGTLANPESPYDNYWFNFPVVIDASGTTIITIDLHGEFSSAGGFMNYYQTYGDPVFGPGAPTISAIAADGITVLESHNLTTDAPFYPDFDPGFLEGDQGVFRGITLTGGATMSYFRISGDYIAMHDISLVAAPEPSTLGLIAVALMLCCYRSKVAVLLRLHHRNP